jgi:hypothetical protein
VLTWTTPLMLWPSGIGMTSPHQEEVPENCHLAAWSTYI